MADLDMIRTALNNNENLTSDLKDNIFELIVVFNMEFPEIALDNFCSKIKNLKISRINSFLTNKVSKYDIDKNTIYFNERELKKEYDVRHLLMLELLKVISATDVYSGFNIDGKFEALNLGYEENLANYLVGNSAEEQVCAHESVMTNLTSIIIGDEVLKKAYFENDSKLLLKAVEEAGIELGAKEGFMSFNALANYYTKVNKWEQNEIQSKFVNMIKNCDLTNNQISAIDTLLIRDNACLGGKGENKTSIEKFYLIKESLKKENSVWIEEETRRKLA